MCIKNPQTWVLGHLLLWSFGPGSLSGWAWSAHGHFFGRGLNGIERLWGRQVRKSALVQCKHLKYMKKPLISTIFFFQPFYSPSSTLTWYMPSMPGNEIGVTVGYMLASKPSSATDFFSVWPKATHFTPGSHSPPVESKGEGQTLEFCFPPAPSYVF